MQRNGGVDRVRELMALATGDEKHAESSTSTLDAIWVLYDRVLKVDPTDPAWESRDRFVLSKGHGPAALYAVLAHLGFFPIDELRSFLAYDSRLGSHPDRTLIPGVEVSTGSLGHGLPIAVGMALALRIKGQLDQRVVVLCGDGELNEGSNWEALMLAPYLGLTNLTLLVIDNHSSIISTSRWDQRLEAFGWSVDLGNGHDHDELLLALSARDSGRPTAVVADIPEGEW
jgi:transketolase